jgi:DNA gyrase/topoisomerase IV subunit A
MNLVGAAPDAEHTLRALQSKSGFDEAQANAVLELQVRQFSQHERSRIVDERESLRCTFDESPTDL